jgi:hypothetical protein
MATTKKKASKKATTKKKASKKATTKAAPRKKAAARKATKPSSVRLGNGRDPVAILTTAWLHDLRTAELLDQGKYHEALARLGLKSAELEATLKQVNPARIRDICGAARRPRIDPRPCG